MKSERKFDNWQFPFVDFFVYAFEWLFFEGPFSPSNDSFSFRFENHYVCGKYGDYNDPKTLVLLGTLYLPRCCGVLKIYKYIFYLAKWDAELRSEGWPCGWEVEMVTRAMRCCCWGRAHRQPRMKAIYMAWRHTLFQAHTLESLGRNANWIGNRLLSVIFANLNIYVYILAVPNPEPFPLAFFLELPLGAHHQLFCIHCGFNYFQHDYQGLIFRGK